MVGPLVAANVLGQAGSVVVFAVFFCSLASSIDSLLASTSDLITEDIYKKMFNPTAGEKKLRKISAGIIITLGLLAWAVCMPRIGTLATVLFFAGPMVGSTIWPIATGLFWKKANSKGALLGMLIGTTVGLFAYFYVGWYTASLCGAGVSMIVVVICTYAFPDNFEWGQLNELKQEST
jgi:Na+/proline symporter